MIRLNAQLVTLDAAAPDEEPKRTITGLAVPWQVSAQLSTGETVLFEKGAIAEDSTSVKLLEFHDDTRVIGKVTALASTDEGLMFEAKIAPTRAGDDALELLKMGALDSVSVGAMPVKFKTTNDGTMLVSEARLIEISVVTVPAYQAAQIYSVAASASEEATPEDANPIPQDSEEENQVNIEETPVEAAVATHPIYAQASKPERLPSASEYIAAILRGGESAVNMTKRLRAAAPDVEVAGNAGLLPEVLISPVYNNFQGRRPVVDACQVRAMPADGAVFRVPYVSTHNSVGQQASDLDTLTASTYAVSSYDITKLTFGGYASVSEQIIDWSTPEIIGSMLDDMARVYAFETDEYAATQLLAGCSQSAVLTDPTSPSEWVSDIYDATSTILTNSNGNLPTHLFLSPNMFAYLGKLVDTTGRPLLAPTMPMNAFGSQVPTGANGVGEAFGLRVVVDRGFAADTVIIGDPSGYQIWEQQKGAISIDVPSNLSRTIAFRGYFATKMVDATKFVKLT
jgi:HK97 family phage prohead protease/HK97 family phage major capsid protein